MFNSKYTDHFEFNTDVICINHRLGYQLKAWNTYVRIALKIPEWKGTSDMPFKKEDAIDQRYMNPETIKKYMCSISMYQ